MVVDGKWGWVGSTNLDNRSLVLNFEANCILHSPSLIAELEAAFTKDLDDAIRMDGKAFAGRPFVGRMVENGCRLLSPLL
jgi:cardiolipin synthase